MKFKAYLFLLTLTVFSYAGTAADKGADPQWRAKAEAFISDYTATYLDLYAISGEAQWVANTIILDGVPSIDRLVNVSDEAMSRHTGSTAVIDQAREFLKHADALTDLQVRQLKAILYKAADKPQTVPELVKQRIAAESAQTSALYGYTFTMDGQPVTPNDIDRILQGEKDPNKRLAAWNASKEVGKTLKDGLVNLVDLRNKTVQALDYKNYFDYQVSDYGMTTQEMMALNDQLLKELRPLFRELHTWVRYELAKRYGQPVPELLPAHWMSDRWAQDWSSLVTVEGVDLDAILAKKEPEWLIKQAERFYVSLGFSELPASFWEKSSLYPVPTNSPYKKNTHASAWHMDLGHDVRSLMSVESNANWYETTHHELGHIYYYLSYTRPEVPPLLRGGANRAFHEAVGSLMGLASMQRPFLEGLGLVQPGQDDQAMQAMLKDALNLVVFMSFSAGTMTHFEHDLYNGLPKDEYNQRWWAHAAKYQGVAPASARGEEYCDAATKTHINDDAAQYYDYALSYVILTQLHLHISKNILKQDPHATNYYGNKEVGAFIAKILEKGATEDWRKVMRDAVGQDISAAPMLDYFAPLMDWLKKQNEGRKATLPEL